MSGVRWNPGEFEIVDEDARERGLTVPSYLRELALEAHERKSKPIRRATVERELLAKTSGQFGKVGNNLNQLSRHARLGRATERELSAAREWLNTRLFPPLYRALGLRNGMKGEAGNQPLTVDRAGLMKALEQCTTAGNNLNELTRKARIGQADDLELQAVLRWLNEHLFPAFSEAMGLQKGGLSAAGKAE